MANFHHGQFVALAAILLARPAIQAEAGVVYFDGTGHWYEAVQVPNGVTWSDAATNAANRGGYLCTITNAAENAFVVALVDISCYSQVSVHGDILGPWLGGFRHANQSGWQWLTGEPFIYSNWYPGQPDGYGGSEQRLQFYAGAVIGSTWGDHPGDPLTGYYLPRGYIVEYNAPILRANLVNGTVVVSWPNPLPGWVLETTGLPLSTSTAWAEVSAEQYLTNETTQFIVLPNPMTNGFYRLRR